MTKCSEWRHKCNRCHRTWYSSNPIDICTCGKENNNLITVKQGDSLLSLLRSWASKYTRRVSKHKIAKTDNFWEGDR